MWRVGGLIQTGGEGVVAYASTDDGDGCGGSGMLDIDRGVRK